MRCLMSWSGGKDAAWALHSLRSGQHAAAPEIVGLITTFNQAFDRSAMHGVRRALMDAQAAAVGLPLWPVPLPWPCDNAEYEKRMRALCERARAAGVEAIVFGDLFLEDVRSYRERQLADTGLRPLFPLWGLNTAALARRMIAAGLRARLTCVDPKQISAAFAGRDFDERLLADLPASADPCGERGEFHSFVYAGPMLRAPLPFRDGETVARDAFVFHDLL